MPPVRDAELICVAPDRLNEVWPHAASLIERAFWTGIGDDDVATVKADLDRGDALLWVVWDGTKLLAAATTKLVKVPTKKLCVITACAGSSIERWKHFIVKLERYAMDEHCDALRIMGRPGWKAILPGYREPWVCIEKSLT